MPIVCPITLLPIGEAELKELDYAVMKHVFASHNELGRLCDEVVYHNDIAARMQTAGIPAATEVPLHVIHRDFRKSYYLDLIVASKVIYELKVASALIGDHKKQVLHYLFLLDARFGKLVNLRPPSVEYRTINAVVNMEQRQRYYLVNERWREVDARCALLRATLVELLDTFGAYLELPFYEEALTWFWGGEVSVLRRVPLMRAGLTLGLQPVHHLTDEIGFKLTAFTHAAEHGETHIRRFFDLTPLRILHWVNLNQDHIHLVTLQK
jgi:GxxExxY protein